MDMHCCMVKLFNRKTFNGSTIQLVNRTNASQFPVYFAPPQFLRPIGVKRRNSLINRNIYESEILFSRCRIAFCAVFLR